MAWLLLAVALTLGLPIGVAYGIWAATGVALTAILGRVLFREPLTALMLGGIALIIAGVFFVELDTDRGCVETEPAPESHHDRQP